MSLIKLDIIQTQTSQNRQDHAWVDTQSIVALAQPRYDGKEWTHIYVDAGTGAKPLVLVSPLEPPALLGHLGSFVGITEVQLQSGYAPVSWFLRVKAIVAITRRPDGKGTVHVRGGMEILVADPDEVAGRAVSISSL